MSQTSRILLHLMTLLVSADISILAAAQSNWDMYGGNPQRSFRVHSDLDFPLSERWAFHCLQPARPAWPKPARQDFWHGVRHIAPSLNFDHAGHAVVHDGRVYFGTSADDKVLCLDARSGELIWKFICGGPVRFAPLALRGNIYIGSDDGFVTCLDAGSGSLKWRHACFGKDYQLPGNERFISLWPVRTGIVTDGKTLYFASGLFPQYGTTLHALEAGNGAEIWSQKLSISPQGYLLLANRSVVVPTSRTNPALFDMKTGQPQGELSSSGGSFALVSDNRIVSGPGRRGGNVTLYDPANETKVMLFAGLKMLLDDRIAYTLRQNSLSAVDTVPYKELSNQITRLRAQLKNVKEDTPKDKASIDRLQQDIRTCQERLPSCTLWKVRIPLPRSALKTQNHIIVGFDDRVVAYHAANGTTVWQAETRGIAEGVAIADEKLFVSTDRGVTQCFSAAETAPLTVHEKARNTSKKMATDDFVRELIGATGIDRGYCLVTDVSDAALLVSLARNTNLHITAVTRDERLLDSLRSQVDTYGLYGRVSIDSAQSPRLPYGDYIFNAVISAETALHRRHSAWPVLELARVTRPCGGVLVAVSQDPIDGFESPPQTDSLPYHKRLPLADAGEWTQLYANPSHTSCSHDKVEGPFRIQWFGRPGPESMIDRHHRPMSTLYKDGRIFIPANDKLIVADAYNGTPLWEKALPGSRRVAALKNSGHMLLDDTSVYVAVEDRCEAYSVHDGESRKVYGLPPSFTGHDWGYINQTDSALVGTCQIRSASFSDLAFSGSLLNGSAIMEGDFKDVVVSDALFALDKKSREPKWIYPNTCIMNNAICIVNNAVYFITTDSPEVVNDDDGRVRIDHFCQGNTHLKAIDLTTGRILFEKPIHLNFEHILFLNGSTDRLIVSGTYNRDQRVYYEVYAFGLDGSDKWQNRYMALDIRGNDPSPLEGSHGEQWQHPVVTRDTLYLRPYAFDLETGRKKQYIARRGGHGCGGFTGSEYYLYGRGDNARFYPTSAEETSGQPFTLTNRPGCWLNIIPAGGLILIPESSSGCTCGYSLEMSIAFAPED